MNVNVGYTVILPSHDFHLWGQTNVAYIKMCYKTSTFICISGTIFWNLTKLCINVNIEYAVILLFYDFPLRAEVKLMLHMYKYFLKHLFRQNRFKQTNRNVVFRDYILTLAWLYCTYASLKTCGIKFIKLIIVWNI